MVYFIQNVFDFQTLSPVQLDVRTHYFLSTVFYTTSKLQSANLSGDLLFCLSGKAMLHVFYYHFKIVFSFVFLLLS